MQRIYLFIGLLFSNIVSAQSPSIEWQKCYGGPGGEGARCIQPTNDGGSIICGNNNSVIGGNVSTGNGSVDWWVVKVDAAGNLIWEKSLGGVNNDYAFSIKQTTDGGYIVAGYTGSDNSGDVGSNHGLDDYWIVKLSSSGTIQWQKTFGGSGRDYAYSVEQTSDGGYIVGGTTNSADGDVVGYHGAGDGWIIKLDSQGNLTWQKSFGGSALDLINDIHQTNDGGYIVAGGTSSNNGDVVNPTNALSTVWIIKLDAIGSIIWQRLYGSVHGYSICKTNDGGFAFTSNCFGNLNGGAGNHGLEDFWIVKLDPLGNLLWQKTMGGSATDQPYCINPTIDGGVVVAGRSVSADGDVVGNHGGMDYWILKLSGTGTVEWTKALGGNTTDFGYYIYQTPDQGFIVAGAAASNNNGDVGPNHGNGNGSTDVWIIKLSAEVVPVSLVNFRANAKERDVICEWETRQEQNSRHFIIERSFEGQIFSAIGQVQAAGQSSSILRYHFDDKQALVTSSEHLFYRLRPVNLDGSFSHSITVKVKLSSFNYLNIYPVPAVDEVNLSFISPGTEPVSIIVYDSKGRKVHERAIHAVKGPNIYELHIDALPPGGYQVILTGRKKYVGRFIKKSN